MKQLDGKRVVQAVFLLVWIVLLCWWIVVLPMSALDHPKLDKLLIAAVLLIALRVVVWRP